MKNEKREEKKFVTKVHRNGGDAIKLSTLGAYGRRGRNDRLVLISPEVCVLFEFKAEGEEPTQLQEYIHRKYRKMGFSCYVVYTAKEAWRLLEAKIKKAKLRSKAVPRAGNKVRAV